VPETDEQLSARFGYAFDMAVTGMAVLSLDHRFVRANAAFRKLVGRSMEELRGLSPADLTHPDHRAADAEGIARVLRGEQAAYVVEKRYVRPDGRVVWARVAARRVDGEDGAVGMFAEATDLTEVLGVREELRAANDRLRLLAEMSDDVALFRMRFVPELATGYVSAGMLALTGRSAEEHYADPTLILECVHPDDRPALAAAMFDKDPPESLPLRFVHPDGAVVHADSRATPIRDETGAVTGVEGIVYVAARREVAEAVRSGDARFRSLVQNATDVVLLVTEDGVVGYASPAITTHLGYDPADVVGSNVFDTGHPEDRPAIRAAFDKAGPGRSVSVEYRVAHREGAERWMHGVVTNLLHDPDVRAYVVNSRDVTEGRALTDELRRRAFRDEGTGLPNALGLREAVSAWTQEEAAFALLRLGVSGLGAIAEVFGHAHAERLACTVAERLRAAAGDGAVLARIGFDDFAVAAEGDGATAVADALLAAFERPFVLDGEPFQLDASIGVAAYPGHGTEPDLLLRRAQRARRAAEERHAGCVVYSTSLDDTSAQSVALLGRLRDAIGAGELALHYQPKVGLGTSRVYGVEALLRWQHPEHGSVPPDRFIPLAERSGLIKPLTEWVVDTAAAQLAEWCAAGLRLSVAVNVTPRNLQDAAFPASVARTLEAYGVAPSLLWLELTERAVMTDPDTAVAACVRLADLGVPLSLDDFGTGQSSFAYVAALPVSEIKIDGRFVGDLAADGANAGITRAIIGLAHHLGRSAIAEGVEDDAALSRLRELDCDAVQGYHVSRPLPPDALREWLATSPWAAPPA
jgi:PAS domain S-box-containing protein